VQGVWGWHVQRGRVNFIDQLHELWDEYNMQWSGHSAVHVFEHKCVLRRWVFFQRRRG
jgi:hypothetical protein